MIAASFGDYYVLQLRATYAAVRSFDHRVMGSFYGPDGLREATRLCEQMHDADLEWHKAHGRMDTDYDGEEDV